MNKQLILKAAGPALLAVAIVGAVVFVKTKPKAERKQMSSMVPVVQVTELTPGTHALNVECLGTVISDKEVALQAQVGGRVFSIHPDLVEGAFVRKGDLLVSIERTDYELAVKRAEASLRSAQSSLRLEEGRQSVAKHEMELVGGDEIDEAYRDLMLREPQLLSAQAAVAQAEASLETAWVNLERTELRAPFDAVVKSADVDEGDIAQAGRTLVELVATDRWFVRASLPVSDLRFFPDIGVTPYTVELRTADGSAVEGELYRLLPDLSPNSRMARVLVSVARPLEQSRSLLLNDVVRLTLFGPEQKDTLLLDRDYLHEGSTLRVMDGESYLRIVPVEVVQGYADRVLVKTPVSSDWKLVISPVPAPIDGMALHLEGASAAPGGKGSGKGRQ